ncbi:MAG: endonuclease/exonuclease/phosphatase family protein [Acidimicrobiales bacterium]
MTTPPARLRVGAMAAFAGAVPAAWSIGAVPGLGIVRVFLPAVAAVAIAAAVVVWRHHWRAPLVASTLGALFAVALVVSPQRPEDAEGPVGETVRVAFSNLLLDNRDPAAADAFAALEADLVVTAETNGQQFLEFQERFGPPVVVGGDDAACSLDGPGRCSSLNVWTDLPVHTVRTSELLRSVRGVQFVVETAVGPLEVVAVHPPAPSVRWWRPGSTTPWGNAALLRDLARTFGGPEGPDVLIGDFNLTDRQPEFAALVEGRTDALRAHRWAGPTSRTWWGRLLRARIDHILVDDRWCIAAPGTIDVPGSDHLGVVSDLGRCASE